MENGENCGAGGKAGGGKKDMSRTQPMPSQFLHGAKKQQQAK